MMDVTKLTFWFRMSPEYGATAFIELENGIRVDIFRYGRLDCVVPSGDKMGKYQVSYPVSDEHSYTTPPMTANEANQFIETLRNRPVDWNRKVVGC